MIWLTIAVLTAMFVVLAVLTGGEEAGKPANSRRTKERLARGGYPTRSWEV